METLADFLTNYIVKKRAISKEDYEIYHYGLQTGLEMLICMAVCFFMAVQMGMMVQCMIFFLVFFSLRSFLGGLHMNSFMACFFLSCTVLYLTLLLVKYCPLSSRMAVLVLACETVTVCFSKPVENSNRPVSEREKKEFLDKIYKILILLWVLIVFCCALGWSRCLTTVGYTLGVIIISMYIEKVKTRLKRGKAESV